MRTLNWWCHEEESNENGEATIDTMEQDFDLSMPWLAPSIPKMVINMSLVEEESNQELPPSDHEEEQAEHEERQPILTQDMEELGNLKSSTTSHPSQPEEGTTMESLGIHIDMVMPATPKM